MRRFSPRQLNAIVSAFPLPAFTLAPDGMVLSWNRAAELVLGWSKEEVVGRPLPTIPPDGRATFAALVERAVREGPIAGVEVRAVRKDGTPVDLSLALAALIGDDGRLDGVSVVAQDVSDRKRAEERQRDELDRLHAILDAIPTPIFFKDAAGAYRGCNRAFQAFVGRSRDQIVGKTVDDIAPPDLAGVYREADLELFRTRGVQVYETSVRYADGTRHDVVFNKATYLDREGNLAGLVGTYLDITERKRAEKALRESEERLHLALEGTNDGLFDWSAASGGVYVGPKLARLLGFEPEEIPRDPERLMRLLHPSDQPRALEQLRSHLAGQTPQYESEHRVSTKRGEWKWLLVRGRVAERAPGGAALRLVGTYRDITEKKKLQSQLEFASRMSAVGALAAGVAHEMNNPLAYVLANLEFALGELGRTHGPAPQGAPASEALQALSEAREGIERVQAIVQDLKAFARQDDGGEVHGPVDVRAVVQTALKMARLEIRHRAAVLLELGDVPSVLASEQRLGQVFLNLLVNAAQAIPEGNTMGNQIRVATRADGDRVIVEVQDTGAGMPPQVRERIFDPFFTTKPPGVGTGLGLTICHGIIAGLGGDIQVESTVGVGTTFRVRLPILAPLSGRKGADERLTAARRARIAVLDDEPLVGRAVGRALSGLHEVIAVSSAREFLQRLDQGERFDLLLCDLMMPETTGPQLYAELSSRYPDAARRTVILTGGAYDEGSMEFLERTRLPCITKPFDVENLREKVTELLGVLGSGEALSPAPPHGSPRRLRDCS